jgi:hypothetical protein
LPFSGLANCTLQITGIVRNAWKKLKKISQPTDLFGVSVVKAQACTLQAGCRSNHFSGRERHGSGF